MIRLRAATLWLISISFVSYGLAGTPEGWRGDATGRYPEATPPLEWSSEDNVVWKTEMPGRSFGSPVVVGDRIFVVSDPAELLAIRASDGQILWRRTVTPADVLGAEAAEALLAEWKALEEKREVLRKESRDLGRERPDAKDEHAAMKTKLESIAGELEELKRTHPVPAKVPSGNSAATPLSDGEYVYAAFGNGLVAAFDMEGERQWARFVEGAPAGFGHSSSPLLLDGKLIVHFNDLVALNAKDGEIAWRTPLPAQHASAVPVRLGDVEAIVSPSGRIVRARDGAVLAGAKALRVAEGSPVVHEGVIYAQNGKTRALRLPTAPGDRVRLELLWEAQTSRGRRTPSPVIQDDLLYGITTDGLLEVSDTRTGEIVIRERLDMDKVYSSPTSAGGHIFITSTEGETIVLAPGREYKVVARNELEPLGSNPVFKGGRMYVRSHKHLYCIGR